MNSYFVIRLYVYLNTEKAVWQLKPKNCTLMCVNVFVLLSFKAFHKKTELIGISLSTNESSLIFLDKKKKWFESYCNYKTACLATSKKG